VRSWAVEVAVELVVMIQQDSTGDKESLLNSINGGAGVVTIGGMDFKGGDLNCEGRCIVKHRFKHQYLDSLTTLTIGCSGT
jgi:hypothetical protein